ncbi:hypothetical protein ACF3MZ_09460 [Paenibacillaceae bacterium WGS1546]|uniref:hypothetical protein n=1 Tax=Cohnella sp. WGS1546 TaxID=3366810 RepID=UPI00372D3D42
MTRLYKNIVDVRDVRVMAIGEGTFLDRLARTLADSGIRNVERLRWDRTSSVEDWRVRVRAADGVLVVGQSLNPEAIRRIYRACREERKICAAAVCAGRTGLAGPLALPGAEADWESAWRRLRQSALRSGAMHPAERDTVEEMLSNVIAHGMLRSIADGPPTELEGSLYLLDSQTLEGGYHAFEPHPIATGALSVERIPDWTGELRKGERWRAEAAAAAQSLGRLVSPATGILHLLEEGDLSQLPLPRCRIQAADPLSEGPARSLPPLVCSGLTHDEARKEAGLSGLEDYLMALIKADFTRGNDQAPSLETGVGATFAEAVLRGLGKCLRRELRERSAARHPLVFAEREAVVADPASRYYAQAIAAMGEEPKLGYGESLLGFPVAWVGAGGAWHGCAGWNRTEARRSALEQALHRLLDPAEAIRLPGVEARSVSLVGDGESRDAEEARPPAKTVARLVAALKRSRVDLSVFVIRAENGLNELAGCAVGVALGGKEERHA